MAIPKHWPWWRRLRARLIWVDIEQANQVKPLRISQKFWRWLLLPAYARVPRPRTGVDDCADLKELLDQILKGCKNGTP